MSEYIYLAVIFSLGFTQQQLKERQHTVLILGLIEPHLD